MNETVYYLTDPELEAYRPLREAAVRKATFFKLAEVPLGDYFSLIDTPGT
ncbi:MAG: hypothetical protein L0332_18600 [Chloroflexi bacterium]|nr:hypothetical protein [Chloroflexota bacterium]MCI0647482.1 hypothetical protein [Chloroflexota bacterium]MCI0728709.1 hypothetical protein [Chloroflexota bacterium]